MINEQETKSIFDNMCNDTYSTCDETLKSVDHFFGLQLKAVESWSMYCINNDYIKEYFDKIDNFQKLTVKEITCRDEWQNLSHIPQTNKLVIVGFYCNRTKGKILNEMADLNMIAKLGETQKVFKARMKEGKKEC